MSQPDPLLVEKSLRIRYEALYRFASDLNSASSLEDAGRALQSNIKYVIEALGCRVVFTTATEHYCYAIHRGNCDFEKGYCLTAWDQASLKRNVPVHLNAKHTDWDGKWMGKHRDKVAHLYIHPYRSGQHSVVFKVTLGDGTDYDSTDFRLIRHMSELIVNKLSQLYLKEQLDFKHQQLEASNASLNDMVEKYDLVNKNLERIVQERTASLQTVNKEINSIFYRASHDFRAPLTTMLGLANLMVSTRDTEELASYKDHFDYTFQKFQYLLNKLTALSVANNEAGEFKTMPFKEIFDDCIQKASAIVTLKDEQVEFELEGLSDFSGNVYTLSHILIFILENSIFYSKVRTPNKIRLTAEVSAHEYRIMVQDTGEGIREDRIEQIFDLYYRGSEKSTGNGLGLFVVKRLVEILNGKVEIESEFGVGTKISITLPRTQASISQNLPER